MNNKNDFFSFESDIKIFFVVIKKLHQIYLPNIINNDNSPSKFSQIRKKKKQNKLLNYQYKKN